MKVFVAGGTGVLGRTLVPQLLDDGHEVRAVARHASRGPTPRGLELIQADILSDDLRELVAGSDAVVHIATAIPAHAAAGADGWDETARLRTSGTRRLLDAALACGVTRYLQQSIVMAYRDGGDEWLDEAAPLDDSVARSEICRPVIEMEAMVRDVGPEQLGWTILRGGGFVGNEARRTLVDALQCGEVVVAGDGSNFVSPINVVDMASAVVAALAVAPAGSIFNIVDEPLRYGDYVDALADLLGVARPRRARNRPLPPSWRCTNDAAKRVLGWLPRERIWPSSGLAQGGGTIDAAAQ